MVWNKKKEESTGTPYNGGVLEITATSEDFQEQKPKPNLPEAYKQRGEVTLLYGDTATSKTRTLCTFPKPLTIIDTEGRAIDVVMHQFKGENITIIEPLEFTGFSGKDDTLFDDHKTLTNIFKAVEDYYNKCVSGEIKGGTLGIDSCKDFWDIVQGWGRTELSKQMTKQGMPKANPMLMSVNNQLDWKIMNKKHSDLMQVLRILAAKYGIHIVLTAKEREIPSYIPPNETTTIKDKIWSQKDLPFFADNIFRLTKEKKGNKVVFVSHCEKLKGMMPMVQPVEGLDYDKIKELMGK